ncbi:MAG: polyamine aminopropyltransferase [Desulfobacteraceae bacterium]|nr:polyamine aminopropyltransferase [Desulfobacteraceae bacterium]
MNPVFLQAAIFITGCAGIVAEYVLSTLATYILGNSVFQWTMVMSLMLFAMGLGSRLSRYFKDYLFDFFLFAEFTLSVLCALSAVVSYSVSAYFQPSSTALIIYFHSILIGMLIGMEIPLVTRINHNYTDLRINISSIMEKDYYGALIGGIFFVFIALPYFGLTYTPAVLGSINFFVAVMLILNYFSILKFKKTIVFAGTVSFLFLTVIFVFAKPVIFFSEQKKYKDTIIYEEQTRFQKIVMTRWKDKIWLYLNGQQQFSTYDEKRYHEPLVHPVMNISNSPENILVMGGGDGLAVREILKYKNVKKIDLVDLDPKMTDLAKNHPVLTSVNKGSLNSEIVNVHNNDAAFFLESSGDIYDVIILDFPDPDSMDLMHLYSEHFYKLINKHLSRTGAFVTQASSPYFTPKVFISIDKTIQSAGFSTIGYHQNVPTMGDWGFIIGTKNDVYSDKILRKKYEEIKLDEVDTDFLTDDVLKSMLYFGKDVFSGIDHEKIMTNTKSHPVIFRYYDKGRWDIY